MSFSEKDREEYLRIARGVGVFRPAEIAVLEEVLDEYEESPYLYFVFEERQGDVLIGFVIFSWVDMTDFSWDVYWLVIDKPFQGKGFGGKLLRRAEDHILTRQERAIIRVETSTKKEYSHARTLYERQGFLEAGRIKDFYGAEDDLIVYTKDVRRL